MKINPFLFLVFLFANVNAQLYQIGHTTVNFVDASRANRSIATEIYYPADIAGDNVAVTTLNNFKFPSLVFGHGFVMTWDAYQNFWNALVPNGYIIAFPKSEGSFSPSHIEYGKDLAFVIDQMNYLGTQSSSIFYQRVSPKNSVMGHSMGGGASFLASSLNTNITTLVNFSPAETTPSAITAAASISIPTLIFAGGNDCVTPPATNQLPMYNGLISSCKTYISINGASHCQMANSNTLCNFGESSCTPTPTITRTVQHAKIFSYLLPWLDFQLKLNCAQGAIFDSQLLADTSIIFQKNCIQCDALQDNGFNFSDEEFVLFPNPVHDYLFIKGIGEECTIKIFDINSKMIYSHRVKEGSSIDISKFISGVYLYQIYNSNTNKMIKGKLIKE